MGLLKICQRRFLAYRIGKLPWLFCILVVLSYSFNLAHTTEMNEVFQQGALKSFISRIPWVLVYAFLLSGIGPLYSKPFMSGFIWGNIVNVLIVIIEISLFFTSGSGIDYSPVERLGIVVQTNNSIENQGLLRPKGVTMDCNYSASFFVLAALLMNASSFLSIGVKRRWISVVLRILLIGTAAFVQSRTAVFSYFIVFMISIGVSFIRRKNLVVFPKTTVLLLLCAIIALVQLSLQNPGFFQNSLIRLQMTDSSSGTRFLYLNDYFQRISNEELSPLLVFLGNGTGTAGFLLSDVGYGKNDFWSPESVYLALLIEQGLVFSVLFTCLLLTCCFRLLTKSPKYSMVVLFLILIGMSYNFLGDRVYWILLIVLMSIPSCSIIGMCNGRYGSRGMIS